MDTITVATINWEYSFQAATAASAGASGASGVVSGVRWDKNVLHFGNNVCFSVSLSLIRCLFVLKVLTNPPLIS